jgi:hypothetical protein
MTRRPSRRDQAELWWPLIARGIGITIGLTQMVAGFLGRSPDASILAFAAGLIVSPNIAGTQRRRNDGRDEDDE